MSDDKELYDEYSIPPFDEKPPVLVPAEEVESLRQQLEEVTRERDELIERLKPKEKRLEFDPALLEDSGEDK